MKIFTAIVVYENGVNIYYAKSLEGIIPQVYDYVEDNWKDSSINGEEIPEDQREAIEMYFDNHESEWLERFEAVETDSMHE